MLSLRYINRKYTTFSYNLQLFRPVFLPFPSPISPLRNASCSAVPTIAFDSALRSYRRSARPTRNRVPAFASAANPPRPNSARNNPAFIRRRCLCADGKIAHKKTTPIAVPLSRMNRNPLGITRTLIPFCLGISPFFAVFRSSMPDSILPTFTFKVFVFSARSHLLRVGKGALSTLLLFDCSAHRKNVPHSQSGDDENFVYSAALTEFVHNSLTFDSASVTRRTHRNGKIIVLCSNGAVLFLSIFL